MAVEPDAELLQQAHGDGPGAHPGGGLPGAGPLQDVAHVGETVLHGSGQVGVAGADAGDTAVAALLGRILHVFHGHGLGPVGPVLVLDGHADGAAQGQAVADARHYVGPVLFDKLATAPPVAPLPPRQLDADVLLADGQGRGDALHDYHQALAMGLACRKPPDHSSLPLLQLIHE